ncbi:Rha family transcriptional regulator [Sphingomonas paucimobilis]|uniref:Rha family transcriptional regulator n=1 Tax=Sphingomonas paucimobilis TaxID=13689 RepID=UPI00196586DA|nr:Rha family transcriptional regulator [Sphingomonas paucimobilis]
MMQDLVRVEAGLVVADSRDVAEAFGRQHQHVLRDIRDLCDRRPDIASTFGRNASTVKGGFGDRESHHYTMTRKGFVVLVGGFKGDRALDFRIAFYDAFEQLEQRLAAMAAEETALAARPVPSIMEDHDRMRNAIAFVRAAQMAKRCPVARRAWAVAGLPDVFGQDQPSTIIGMDVAVSSIVRDWSTERLEWVEGARTPMAWLYEDFRHWCRDQGVPPMSLTNFGRTLTRMGVDSFKSSAMQRCGIRLRAQEVS